MVVQCRVCGVLESECEVCQWARENVLPTEEEKEVSQYERKKMIRIYKEYNDILHEFYKADRECDLPDYN